MNVYLFTGPCLHGDCDFIGRQLQQLSSILMREATAVGREDLDMGALLQCRRIVGVNYEILIDEVRALDKLRRLLAFQCDRFLGL